MKNTIRKIAILGGVASGIISLLGLATTTAMAHGDEKHSPAGQKNTDCPETREQMQNGKTTDEHMQGCHEQSHKEKAEHKPHEGHQTGDHMKGGKMMNQR